VRACMFAWMHAMQGLAFAKCTQAYAAACMHACVRVCVRACVRACMHACMHACVNACEPACVHSGCLAEADCAAPCHCVICKRTRVDVFVRTGLASKQAGSPPPEAGLMLCASLMKSVAITHSSRKQWRSQG